MTKAAIKERDYSSICVQRCGGACCDPWWGVIHYSLKKSYSPANEEALLRELVHGIEKREKRIREAYVTKESPPRPLFGRPEAYNLILRDIKKEGPLLRLDLIVMFAFRCRFLSDINTCLIHPTALEGRDIRPPHCARLGTVAARKGEEGFCRIISAAVMSEDLADASTSVDEAIELEKKTTQKYLSEGVPSAGDAARKALEKVRAFCGEETKSEDEAAGGKKTGRNEPCPCGSGKKYKKCHGK